LLIIKLYVFQLIQRKMTDKVVETSLTIYVFIAQRPSTMKLHQLVGKSFICNSVFCAYFNIYPDIS